MIEKLDTILRNPELGLESFFKPAEVTISQAAIDEIFKTVGSKESESGGILLKKSGQDAITKFIFDSTGSTTHASYSPDTEKLEEVCEQAMSDL